MRDFSYTMSGGAARGQTWTVSGAIRLPPGDFADAFDKAMADAFQKLTKGEAVFGYPDLTCAGPYKVRKFSLEEGASS